MLRTQTGAWLRIPNRIMAVLHLDMLHDCLCKILRTCVCMVAKAPRRARILFPAPAANGSPQPACLNLQAS